jgi:hypothetical protein
LHVEYNSRVINPTLVCLFLGLTYIFFLLVSFIKLNLESFVLGCLMKRDHVKSLFDLKKKKIKIIKFVIVKFTIKKLANNNRNINEKYFIVIF